MDRFCRSTGSANAKNSFGGKRRKLGGSSNVTSNSKIVRLTFLSACLLSEHRENHMVKTLACWSVGQEGIVSRLRQFLGASEEPSETPPAQLAISSAQKREAKLEAMVGPPPQAPQMPKGAMAQTCPQIIMPSLAATLGPRHLYRISGVCNAAGVYIYGSVGSGKSMIMDRFYDVVQREQRVPRFRRMHFNAALLEVQGQPTFFCNAPRCTFSTKTTCKGVPGFLSAIGLTLGLSERGDGCMQPTPGIPQVHSRLHKLEAERLAMDHKQMEAYAQQVALRDLRNASRDSDNAEAADQLAQVRSHQSLRDPRFESWAGQSCRLSKCCDWLTAGITCNGVRHS